MIKNFFKHLKVVTKHRWLVFKLCCRVGIPFRGLVHDLSKFSPTEFWESAKYYQGNKSPIPVTREIKGYSEAWLHHKARNKHHTEYWIDSLSKSYAILIPYKYAVEMACDKMAASITYNGKEWNNSSMYDYWQKEKKLLVINPKTDNFLTEVFKQVKEQGIEKVYTKKNLKAMYKKYCIDDNTQYRYEFKGEWKKVEE